MTLPHIGARRRLRATAGRLRDLRYRLALRRLWRGRPREYHAYLDVQLRRTLSKRRTDPGVGATLLVGEVAARLPAGADVLCIGCRNGFELDRFRLLGCNAVGIDLFSQRRDIFVMDMHDLAFGDDAFDAVYASHSLEHAYDLPAALREIGRVARAGAIVGVEVPVRHKGSDADLLEFDDLDDVSASLASVVDEVLWSEELPPRSPRNGQGSAVARIVFRLEKAPAFAPRPAHVGPRRGWLSAGTRAAGVAIVAIALLFTTFGIVPELLGDWPYNAFGKNSRAHAAHVPRRAPVPAAAARTAAL